MSALLPFIISGIADGAIYGLLGAGLVLTYKTSGIFNFGYGAIATIAAYVFYFLHTVHGLSWELSFVLAVAVAGPILGLGMEWVSRQLAQQPISYKIVGTIGIVLLVEGLASVWRGTTTVTVAAYLPGSGSGFVLLGDHVLYSQVTLAVIGVGCVASLFAVFRWTRLGIAMRAVVDNPGLLAMQGTNPRGVRLTSWMTGCIFAAASGVLLLPALGLNAITLTFLVVQAFGAAAIGAFSSLPLAFGGGILVGLLSNISEKYVVDQTWLGGLPEGLPFILLIIVLLVLPRRKLIIRSASARINRVQWHAPARVRIAIGAAITILLLLVPELVGVNKLSYFSIGLSEAIIILSLGLLVRNSGQVSLCQSVFAAMGATTFSHLAVGDSMPWLVSVLLSCLIIVPVGALLAFPAIRLSGVFLALATLGFGIMVQYLVYAQGFMFSSTEGGRAIPRPSFASSNTSFYYVVLAFVIVVALLMLGIRHARIGRMLRGIGEAPVAVNALGLSSNVTRVIVFAMSAFLAALGGILYGGSIHYAVSTDAYFQPFYSLTLIGILALAPFAEPWYALFVGVAAIVPAYLPSSLHTTAWLNALFGLSAIAVAMQGGPASMPEKVRHWLDRLGGRGAGRSATRGLEGSGPRDLRGGPSVRVSSWAEGVAGLTVEGLSVRFGGLQALSNLALEAPLGRITGLIGPNGAGKTTAFDACSGLNRRVTGSICLHGAEITNLGPAARARMGLGRTFQQVQLAESLSVRDNVALGCESSQAGRAVLGQLIAPRGQARYTRMATAEAVQLCGLTEIASVGAGALTTGQRRLVEVARCLAGSFDVLLLDEPSAGLDAQETAALEAVLRQIVRERGYGVLLVEHDMSLVMRSCEYVYVLDFGELIFEGTPEAVASSQSVRAAYLGNESVSVASEGVAP